MQDAGCTMAELLHHGSAKATSSMRAKINTGSGLGNRYGCKVVHAYSGFKAESLLEPGYVRGPRQPGLAIQAQMLSLLSNTSTIVCPRVQALKFRTGSNRDS